MHFSRTRKNTHTHSSTRSVRCSYFLHLPHSSILSSSSFYPICVHPSILFRAMLKSNRFMQQWIRLFQREDVQQECREWFHVGMQWVWRELRPFTWIQQEIQMYVYIIVGFLAAIFILLLACLILLVTLVNANRPLSFPSLHPFD